MAKAFSFEEGMAELEELVAALERGEMTLDESFKAYEKGVKLASRLKDTLDQGEKRIQMLTGSLTKTDITDEVTTQ